jgi:hypothetical protein
MAVLLCLTTSCSHFDELDSPNNESWQEDGIFDTPSSLHLTQEQDYALVEKDGPDVDRRLNQEL